MRDRLLGDIVAFTALPAVWVGQPPESIARALAQSLDRSLPLEAVAVLLRVDGSVVQARAGAVDGLDDDVEAWMLSRPLSERTLRMEVGPMGAHGAILLRGEEMAAERLLVARLAANLADTAMREASLDRQAAASREQLARMEKLSALGQLVSGVAHELRTPLTYAGNNIFLARRRLERAHGLAAQDREAIETLLAEVSSAHERIEQTVGTLRRLSSPRSRERSYVGLSDAVAEAMRLFALTHVGPVAVERRLEARGIVRGDRVELQQVVLNLMQNASEASPHGATIVVATEEDDVALRLVVEDDGPGIPEERRGRLFDPFYTTKPEGTGLGLSIVRRIVENHGASITVDRSASGGARFEIEFPRPADAVPVREEGLAGQVARGPLTSS